MMDFNWGDEIEIYKVRRSEKVAVHPPSVHFEGDEDEKIIFFN